MYKATVIPRFEVEIRLIHESFDVNNAWHRVRRTAARLGGFPTFFRAVLPPRSSRRTNTRQRVATVEAASDSPPRWLGNARWRGSYASQQFG